MVPPPPETLPPLGDTPGAGQGYRGHDQFAVVENRLARRFPVYRDGDTVIYEVLDLGDEGS